MTNHRQKPPTPNTDPEKTPGEGERGRSGRAAWPEPVTGGPDSSVTRFWGVVAAFIAVTLLLVVLTAVGVELLSGVRSFIRGESLWSKAQKDAVYHLRSYALEGDAGHLEAYRSSLEIIHGDRLARISLLAEPPDLERAREGFLAGGNDPQDIDAMMRMFRWLRTQAFFRRAVGIWEQADEEMSHLEELGEQIRAADRGSEDELSILLSRLDRSNRELARLELRFAHTMSVAARSLERWLVLLITGVALVLMGGAVTMAWRLIRYARTSEQALAESERRYRALAENSAVGIWQLSPEGDTTYLNPAMQEILEVEDPAQVLGTTYHRFFGPEGLERVEEERARRPAGVPSTYEAELMGARGTRRSVLISGAPILGPGGELTGTIGTIIDITERKEAEELLQHQALHDPLTDLPNRTLFLHRLEAAVRRSRDNGSLVAVLFLDLDRFKVINDSLGHASGDRVLTMMGHRLADCLRDEDTVARLGGDEFAVLLEHQTTWQGAINTARRLTDVIEQPLEMAGARLRITASLGIALGRGSVDASSLLRDADIAMYAAKRKGGGQHHVFDPLQDNRNAFQLQFENALWQAVERKELRLVYQPLVDLAAGQVTAFEALVRWRRPGGDTILPERFVPMAEETGAIEPIGRWVLEEACRQAAEWHRRFPDLGPGMNVNLSGRQLRLPGLADDLEQILEASGLAPESLCLEITESMLAQVPERVAALRDQGVRIAVDDFGAGYSSLAALRSLPVDILKIDRTFLGGLGDDAQETALVMAAVQLAQALKLEVIAEGVETRQQLELLRQLDCQVAQGFFFAHPLSPEEVEELLESPPTW